MTGHQKYIQFSGKMVQSPLGQALWLPVDWQASACASQLGWSGLVASS